MWIAAILFLVICAVVSLKVPTIRDHLSLFYWRLRLINLPRGQGSGPKTILEPNANSGVSVFLAGISEKEWKVSHKWVPANQSVTISSNQMILSLGCWWDDSGNVSPLPKDSLGEFVAVPRKSDLANGPLQNQLAYQSAPAAGEHVVTPPNLGARGDGFFHLLRIEGLDAASPIRDRGETRISHPMVTGKDPNSIQKIEVSTDGAVAQEGDLAVAFFSMDACENPDIKLQTPEGWTLIAANNRALQNIGYLVCCKIVSQPGKQRVTCTWTDDSTFVAEATLVVFKARQKT
jgi:hypothetical protein